MLQEMRLVLRAHRVPGIGDEIPTMSQVFRMASVGGARTTGYGEQIGTIAEGKAADLSLIDWKQISYPYLDDEMPLLDAVIQRAKTAGMRTVMCDGEVIYDNGRFTRVDRDNALKTLHDELQARALRRRGRAAQPLQGAAAACEEVLCELFRSGEARAVLPAEFESVGQ